jgi:uncharacterized phage protein gp47/JayE
MVDVVLTGQIGTLIAQGVVADITTAQQWDLPAQVVIPEAGQILVTATCEKLGAVTALPGTLTRIVTPVRGWQSVTNPTAAMPGAPVESDTALRQRQRASVALPSRTVLQGVAEAVDALEGVTRQRAYENDTPFTDTNNIPAHSFSLVVEGGDADAIAQVIAKKKTPGAGTYGDTTITLTDAYGLPITIHFQRPEANAVCVAITLKALAGYSSRTGVIIQQTVAKTINEVAIGGGVCGAVEWCDVLTAASRVAAGEASFKITALTLSDSNGAGTPDLPLGFQQVATCTPDDVTLTVI